MKKLIFLAIALIALNSFGQNNKNDKLYNFNRLENRIDSLKLEIDTIKLDPNSAYILKRGIIRNEEKIYDVKKKYNDEHESLFAKFLLNWTTFLTSVLAFLLYVFGYNLSYKGILKKMKVEVNTKISELSGVEIEFVKKNLDEFQKHINLKKTSKIVILNEVNTEMPNSFKKIIDLYENHEYINIENLKESLNPKILNKLKDANLIIIENQIQKNEWKIGLKQEIRVLEGFSEESKKIIEKENLKIRAVNKIPQENLKNLRNLATIICKEIPLIYYGYGIFPRINDDEIQENITFANAPSQLYGNMLNMLKFKLETRF